MIISTWALGLLLILLLALLVARRRNIKIDRLPPEHRAKENELYEAFGLETPHKECLPKGHEDKLKEVEAAFSPKKKAGRPRKSAAPQKAVKKTAKGVTKKKPSAKKKK